MKRLLNMLILVAASAAAVVHAAPSVELKVTGVIRPTACTPILAADGTVDYGNISAATLRSGQPTALPARQIALTVSCNAAAKIALSVIDNRAGSRVAGIMDSLRAGSEYNFGLGTVAGKKVGGYLLSFDDGANADGRSVSSIVSSDRGNSWSANAGYIHHEGNYFSFSENGAVPSAQKILSALIRVQPMLNKAEELPLNQEVQLDGSATIEVKYL
jgi:type 1 fimbria pilin